MLSQNHKQCSICLEHKPQNLFSFSGYVRKTDGIKLLRPYCNVCNSATASSWRKKNLAKDVLRVALRRKIAKQATPNYISKEDLLPIYEEARLKGLTVDHIIPLKHPLVCGLNVPWNLQLLTKSENSSKNNRFTC